MTPPLTGVRIIAVEQYAAGPFGTMLLADLGAEIIKIENPSDGGDMSRSVGPHFTETGESLFFHSFNRNKQSITLNLKKPAARGVLHDLLRSADGLFNNLRGDQPERLALTYNQLKDVNPQLVCAHLSAYGRTGSRKNWPGYDYLMQAEAGYLSLTGEPDGPPSRCGLSLVDYMTGTIAALALVSGILNARKTGKGCDVDTSLFDVALHNLTYLGLWHLNTGAMPAREARSNHPSLTPSQLYHTADGWIFVMCNKAKFWPILLEKIGRAELASDPLFNSFENRLKNRDRLTGVLDAIFVERTTDEWLRVLGGAVPAAAVYNVAEALAAPFVQERLRTAQVKKPKGEAMRMLAGPIQVNGVVQDVRPAPSLGTDTQVVLTGLDYADEFIESLRKKGVV